jgi:2-methylcitrate dehydratase PrpD
LIEVKHDQRFDRHFPARAESEIEIITKNNKRYCSGAKQAAGDWDNPLSPEELENKYYWLMEQVKNNEEAVRIAEYIDTLELNDNLQPLMALL